MKSFHILNVASALSFAIAISATDASATPVNQIYAFAGFTNGDGTTTLPIQHIDSSFAPMSDEWRGGMTYGNQSSDDFTNASVDLQGKASPGVLGVAATVAASGRNLSPLAIAYAIAGFEDTLTFTGGKGNGTFTPIFEVHGRGSDSAQLAGFNGPVGSSTVTLAINEHLTDPGNFVIDATNLSVNQKIIGAPIPFVFGAPVDFLAWLEASTAVDCVTVDIGDQCMDWIGGFADSLFNDTATLTGIVVTDGSGAQISDFTITSASGVRYSANGVALPAAVPEPASILLLGTGVVGMVVRRRRKLCRRA